MPSIQFSCKRYFLTMVYLLFGILRRKTKQREEKLSAMLVLHLLVASLVGHSLAVANPNRQNSDNEAAGPLLIYATEGETKSNEDGQKAGLRRSIPPGAAMSFGGFGAGAGLGPFAGASGFGLGSGMAGNSLIADGFGLGSIGLTGTVNPLAFRTSMGYSPMGASFGGLGSAGLFNQHGLGSVNMFNRQGLMANGFGGLGGVGGLGDFSGYSNLGHSGLNGLSGYNSYGLGGLGGVSGFHSGIGGLNGFSSGLGALNGFSNNLGGLSGVNGFSNYNGFGRLNNGNNGFSGITELANQHGFNHNSGFGNSGFDSFGGVNRANGNGQSSFNSQSSFGNPSFFSNQGSFSGQSSFSDQNRFNGQGSFSSNSGFNTPSQFGGNAFGDTYSFKRSPFDPTSPYYTRLYEPSDSFSSQDEQSGSSGFGNKRNTADSASNLTGGRAKTVINQTAGGQVRTNSNASI